MAYREGLHPVDAGGCRFGVQLPQPGGPQITEADRSVSRGLIPSTQTCSGRVDLGLGRRDRCGVGLGPDSRVDQLADRLGQRLVQRA